MNCVQRDMRTQTHMMFAPGSSTSLKLLDVTEIPPACLQVHNRIKTVETR